MSKVETAETTETEAELPESDTKPEPETCATCNAPLFERELGYSQCDACKNAPRGGK